MNIYAYVKINIKTNNINSELLLQIGCPPFPTLLRGSQTVGELRARTERLYAFDSLEEVTAVLTS